jgi:F420-non-reducing hydrogenase iron-sulfur subunit
MGIEPQRVQLVWASAAEGVKLAQEINRMVEEIRALGPLNWGKNESILPVQETALEVPA